MNRLARLLEPRRAAVRSHAVFTGNRPPASRAPHPMSTHALWWLPLYLLQPTRWLGRLPADGWWMLQPELEWRAGTPPCVGAQLYAPRAAAPLMLARLAGEELGYPVDIEPSSVQFACLTPETRTEPAYLVWRDTASARP